MASGFKYVVTGHGPVTLPDGFQVNREVVARSKLLCISPSALLQRAEDTITTYSDFRYSTRSPFWAVVSPSEKNLS